ncbi:GAF and ANTAR domain-containing protein [Plantactinospora sonchi]|uniref:GAF and ANTAR domain-containing protein n=1 Tax=Plantactinospora sonchi TaxID=1544735 RepID=A0ABU7RLT7_9ACTN
MAPSHLDPVDALVELGQIKLGETDLHGVQESIVGLAKRAVPAAREVSVTLVRGAEAQTVAATSPVAVSLEEWQYQRGTGPCLDAAEAGRTLSVPDTSVEVRWPDWAARAQAEGIRSLLSIGLPVQDTVVGALNMYGARPEAFDEESIALARAFAEYAAVALANAHLYETTTTVVRQLQTAMESRAVIEQAKGIIMGERRCTADEAFALLVKVSQNSNRKVREVAAALVTQAGQPRSG